MARSNNNRLGSWATRRVDNNNATWRWFDDFFTYGDTTPYGSYLIVSNNGTYVCANAEAGHPGIYEIGTGSGATYYSGMSFNATALLLGGGTLSYEALIRVPILSDSTDEFDFRIGIGDAQGADCTDGVYFEYDRNSSVNWRICAAALGTRTKTNTTVAVQANTWTKLRIEINAAATSAQFFINGVSVGTITTNIPTGDGRYVAPHFAGIVKSAGTTARTAQMDYIDICQTLTIAR